MNQSDIQQEKAYEVVYKTILPKLVNTLAKENIIKKDDLNDKKYVLEKVLEYIENNNIQYEFALDYRNDILKNAESFYNIDYNLSLTLYSTFIEHTINSIIDLYCRENSVSEKSIIEIIRNINILGKFTWLIDLIKISKISEDKLKLIKKITESRNSYVHYKWKYKNVENDNFDTKIPLSEIKSLIKYLKTYESKFEYKNLKGKIQNL